MCNKLIFSKCIEYKANKKGILKIFFFLSDMLVTSNLIFIFAPAIRDGYPVAIWRGSSVG
jgi:hypothetical protein